MWAVCLVTQSCPTLCDPMDCTCSSVHGDSAGKNTGVGCHALFQVIFPIQGLNTGLPRYRQILYCLSPQGRPWILEWVAYSFSRRSSQPRNPTRISCIAGRFFTSWATRDVYLLNSVRKSVDPVFIMITITNFKSGNMLKKKNYIVNYSS